MSDIPKRLKCADCSMWKFIEGEGRCRYRDIHRYSWDMTCNTFRFPLSVSEPEPEQEQVTFRERRKLPMTPQDRLACTDCDLWEFVDGYGECTDNEIRRFSWEMTCNSFVPQNPEPEPEPEPVTEKSKVWTSIAAEKTIYAIGRYIKDSCSRLLLLDTLTALSREAALAQRITDDLHTLKARATQATPPLQPPPCSHWAEHLKTVRYAYVRGNIDLDVVLAALDPGQTDNIIVTDLINAWEWQKMQNDTPDGPHEVFDPDEDDLAF